MQMMGENLLEDEKLFNFDGPDDDNNEYDDDLDIGETEAIEEEKFDEDDL